MPSGSHELHPILEHHRNNHDFFNVEHSKGHILSHKKKHINIFSCLSDTPLCCQTGHQKSRQGSERS